MTKDSLSSHKKTSYKGVIIFAIIALFIYGAWTKLRVDICLSDARDAYEQNWASACKLIGKKKDCALPAITAKYIDSKLDKEKNFCVSYG